MIRPRLAIFAGACALATQPSLGASAGLYGSLSLVPGLGQAIQGNPGEGLAWFAASLGLMGQSKSYLQQAGFDLWMYNMYDAYRDGGGANTSKESLFENSIAFLNPMNIVDPIGAPIIAYGALGGASGGYPALKSPSEFFTNGFVGLGEEALFRGFLFPSFSGVFSSKPIGAITSSAVFSLAHFTNGKQDLQFSPLTQRFIAGLLFCWQADRNHYDLRKNIFAHAWYDILVDDGGQIRGFQMKLPLP